MLRLKDVLVSAALCLAVAAPALALDGVPAAVKTKQQGDGWLLTDAADGMTLYITDRDEATPGKSSCTAECAVTWPPFLAAADAKPQGHWSIITRDDGAKQWAYKNMPLYKYASDTFPGGTFGDGVNTVWHVAFQQIPTPGEVKIGQTLLGQVLTDTKGLTLYTTDGKCDEKCQQTWRPIGAPRLANAFSDWTIVTLDNGFRQWAYKGKPLYRYTGDISPAETKGADIKGWAVALLEPAPPMPPWATVQASDAGALIANEKGITIYAHAYNPRARRVLGRPTDCKGECIDDTVWKPFYADDNAKPVGSWAIVTLEDGKKQWSYKGNKIFTHIHDEKPGDFKGIRFGGDRSWSAIMRSGQPMQGVSVGG
jgi:predicted lipoprotein with Yx(FWY)xxD motif